MLRPLSMLIQSRYEAKVKKRQTSTVDAFKARLITTEQRPREHFQRKVSRVDPGQLQIVQQPTTDFIFHGACGHPAIALGTHGSTSCAMDARRRPIADTLVCAPGKSASTLDTLGAIRRVPADTADSITSRMSPQLVRYEETSPASIPSRYAQDLSQAQPIYNNANGVDLHQANSNVPVPSVPQFPSRLVREYDRQNHTTPLQDHDRSLDMSRSMRGHRRAGQVQLEVYSNNLTGDPGDMFTNTRMSNNEFCNTSSSPARIGSEMARALGGQSMGICEYHPGNDYSRSMRGQLTTRRTWREGIGQDIANDLSFSSQRLAIENAAQENGALARSDGAGRQLVAEPGSRLQRYYIGEDRNLYHDAVLHNGDAMMVPRHIRQRDSHMQNASAERWL
jgi:hypothetical protein